MVTAIHSGQNGLELTIINTYVLPQSAHTIQIDKQNHLLTYVIPEVKNALNRTARKPELTVAVRYKERLMPVVYKVYGDSEAQSGTYWVAQNHH